MDIADSASPPSPSPGDGDSDVVQGENNQPEPIEEDVETTCWGCGLRVLVSSRETGFKCGWCGAITAQNAVKTDNKPCWWRRWRDRFVVSIVVIFMLFFICCGIWVICPVAFSISFFCGVLHLTIAVTLSISTLSFFCLAAFHPAGSPPMILWGSYPTVGKGGLENHTYCPYCSRPKPPRTHHCRSCGMCILNMDHHCPFIGNCVGAANHRVFILFLISSVTSMLYVTVMSGYTALHIWHPLQRGPLYLLNGLPRTELIFGDLKQEILVLLRSIVFLSTKEVILVNLLIASIAVGFGLSILLWQQLGYIYVGKTYLSYLNAVNSKDKVEKDCRNFLRFFGCPQNAAAYLPSYWRSTKIHDK